MDIGRSNFAEACVDFHAHLGGASFVSMDCEMTGIWTQQPELRQTLKDSPQDRYNKQRVVASRYNLVQVGVCLFTEDGSGGYVARPYNFYVFPEKGDDIILSASAIAFLKKNGMDWQKWISDGIPYLNRTREGWLRGKLCPEEEAVGAAPEPADGEVAAAPKKPKRRRLVLDQDPDISFVDEAMEALGEWLREGDEAAALTGSLTEFKLKSCNSYLRRALREHIDEKFEEYGLVAETRDDDRYSPLFVLRLSDEEKETRAVERKARKKAELAAAVGFRAIFSALAESRLPIVAHNCMFDLMFVFQNFEADLPVALSSFKEQLLAQWPCVVDTKYCATSGLADGPEDDVILESFCSQKGTFAPQRYPDTTVEGLYKQVVETEEGCKVGITADEGFGRYNPGEDGKCDAYHEAGWDAFCTGAIYARLAAKAGGVVSLAEAAANQVFSFHNSLYTCNLAGDNALKVLAPHFLVAGCVPGTKDDELLALLGPAAAGGKLKWISKTEYLLVMHEWSLNDLKGRAARLQAGQKFVAGAAPLTITAFSDGGTPPMPVVAEPSGWSLAGVARAAWAAIRFSSALSATAVPLEPPPLGGKAAPAPSPKRKRTDE